MTHDGSTRHDMASTEDATKSPSNRGFSTLPAWVHALGLAAGFFLLGWLGARLSIRPHAFVTVWFPSGLYLAALLLHPRRQWPMLVAGGMLGNVAFDLVNGQTAFTSLFFCIANSLESVLGATLMRRFVCQKPNFENVREVLGLVVFSALVSTPIAAAIGTAVVMQLDGSVHFLTHGILWWSASLNGTIMLAPMLLNWVRGECPVPPGNRRQIFEGVAIAILLVAVVWFVSAMELKMLGGFKYLLIPLVGWAAVRFGIRGASLATLLIAIVFAWFQNHYFSGPGPQNLDKVQRAMINQPFIALTGVGGLLLAALVSERRRAALRVRENEERFRQFFENLGEYCYIVSLDGRILNVNGSALRALGLSRDHLIDRPITSIYAPEDRPRVDAMLDRWRNGEAVRDQELALITADGERRQVLLNSVPIRDPSGQVIHSASVQVDITERLRLGDQLRQAQKLEAVGRLAGGIAHDFNNIVSATLMHLGLLRSHTRFDEASSEILRELEASGGEPRRQRPRRHALWRHHPHRDRERRGGRRGRRVRHSSERRDSRREVLGHHGLRQRRRHGRLDSRAHLRTVLHHQGEGQGDRPRSRDGLRHRHPVMPKGLGGISPGLP
jgi:PAS domain S-box-containing protein